MIGRRERPRRPRAGVVTEVLDRASLLASLEGRGGAGLAARHLDTLVDARLRSVTGLSALTSVLAVSYLERIKHALATLSLPAGVEVTTRGYVAHLVVEADPAAFGAHDVPVLGSLPELRHGRPPQDLLTRVVKATRRDFERIRAIDEATWEAYVACVTYRVHEHGSGLEVKERARGAPGSCGSAYLDPLVVDGLLRFGWVLRQVDLHYHLAPEYLEGGNLGGE